MQQIGRNEVHVSDFAVGHYMNTDCWCEPTQIWWAKSKGVKILIVEHQDYLNASHDFVLKKRDEKPDGITYFLNSIFHEEDDYYEEEDEIL